MALTESENIKAAVNHSQLGVKLGRFLSMGWSDGCTQWPDYLVQSCQISRLSR